MTTHLLTNGLLRNLMVQKSNGNFDEIGKNNKMVEATPYYTMSIDSGDINNDGSFELLSTDMTIDENTKTDYCSAIHGSFDRSLCRNVFQASKKLSGSNSLGDALKICNRFSKATLYNSCLATYLLNVKNISTTKKFVTIYQKFFIPLNLNVRKVVLGPKNTIILMSFGRNLMVILMKLEKIIKW